MLRHWPIITLQRRDFCEVLWGHIEKVSPMSVVTLLLSPLLWKDNFFFRILPIYFRHTYFLVHLLMAISTSKQEFQIYQTTKHTIHATKKSVENVNNKIPLWWCKYFVTNYSYMWCVTLIPGYIYTFITYIYIYIYICAINLLRHEQLCLMMFNERCSFEKYFFHHWAWLSMSITW